MSALCLQIICNTQYSSMQMICVVPSYGGKIFHCANKDLEQEVPCSNEILRICCNLLLHITTPFLRSWRCQTLLIHTSSIINPKSAVGDRSEGKIAVKYSCEIKSIMVSQRGWFHIVSDVI